MAYYGTTSTLQADDDKVISGSYDLTLKVWDIKTGHCKLTLRYRHGHLCWGLHVHVGFPANSIYPPPHMIHARGHTDAVLCVQFDKEKVVSGSKDTTIKVSRGII